MASYLLSGNGNDTELPLVVRKLTALPNRVYQATVGRVLESDNMLVAFVFYFLKLLGAGAKHN